VPLYEFSCSKGHEFESLVPMGQESVFCDCGDAARRVHTPNRILNRASAHWKTSVGTFTSHSDYTKAMKEYEPVDLKRTRNMYKSGAPNMPSLQKLRAKFADGRWKRETWDKAGFLLRNGLVKKPTASVAVAN
jgi:hypothetical protein